MLVGRPVPKVEPWRCTPSARRRSDPLLATAAPAARWLLVEAPGAWGRHALRDSDFSPDVAEQLLARAAEQGMRVQAIRRPPDRSGSTRPRRWALVDSGVRSPPTSWWGEYGEDAELLGLALDAPQGRPSTDPIFLLCTHGRHDACCALFGRPAFAELAARYPDRTWETSHVGGDRFAANLVILPDGLYYGGLDGDSALHVADAHAEGLLVLAHYRGASIHPTPAQAGEHYLRALLGERRITAVAVLTVRQLDQHRWVVRLAHAGRGAYDVDVRAGHAPEMHRLTCSASHPAAARLFELVSVQEVGRSDGT